MCGQLERPGSLGVAGNEHILWVYKYGRGDANAEIVRFAYRTADDKVSGRFWRGPVVTGRVAHSVVRGTSIHVFFADGTHRRFAPVRAGTMSAVQSRVRELDLPDAALPIALAADEPRACLCALVPARVARKVIADHLRRAEWEKRPSEDDASSPEPTGDAESAAPETVAEMTEGIELAIVRYQAGKWHFDREAPRDLTLDDTMSAMTAADGRVHLLYRRHGASDEWLWRSSAGSDSEWSTPVPMIRSEYVTDVAAGWLEKAPAVAVAEHAIVDDAIAIRVLRAAADLWAATGLTDDIGRPARFSTPLALGVFGDRIAVATTAETGVPQVAFYAPDTGRSTAPPTVVSVLIPPPLPRVSPMARQIFQYGILAAALAAVFLWRRDRMTVMVPLKPEQACARLNRRVAALLLDLLILAPIWVPVVFALWRSGAPNVSMSEQLAQPQAPSGALFWGGAAVGAIFGLYAGILELVLGHTFGKRIVGCRVATEDGERCGLRAILIRNLLRVVEFHFLPLVLLVVLTPSRQRLGDILARTVVVEHSVGSAHPAQGEDEGDSPNGESN